MTTARPADHTVRLKKPVATLTSGETLTTNLKNITDVLGDFTLFPTVISTPGIAYITRTQTLSAAFTVPLGGNRPGERCGGSCKACSLYFPSVNVHYWPVESPNTACLTSTVAGPDLSKQMKRGLKVVARSLEVPRGVSTLVNDEGFTFTSPSVYIGNFLPQNLSARLYSYSEIF